MLERSNGSVPAAGMSTSERDGWVVRLQSAWRSLPPEVKATLQPTLGAALRETFYDETGLAVWQSSL